MSPRRRLGLLALVALLVVTGVAVGVVRSLGGGVPQDEPGPVLLVPGYGGDTASLEPLARALTRSGRDARVVDTGDGTGDLRTQAEALARAADAAMSGGAPSVDVVGYSAGGVVARIWVADLGGGEQARRVVTLGSPHHGADVATLGAVLASGACPTACRQLAAGSDLLSGLPDTPDGPLWVSLWTADDETVTPPDSARLAGAVDIQLQDLACGGGPVSHGQLPRDAVVVGVVLRALAVAPLEEPPTPADCVPLRDAGDAALGTSTAEGA